MVVMGEYLALAVKVDKASSRRSPRRGASARRAAEGVAAREGIIVEGRGVGLSRRGGRRLQRHLHLDRLVRQQDDRARQRVVAQHRLIHGHASDVRRRGEPAAVETGLQIRIDGAGHRWAEHVPDAAVETGLL